MLFSDEFFFFEEFGKLKFILYVDLECNGFGDIWKFIIELRSFFFIEVYNDFEIYKVFWYVLGLIGKDILGKVMLNLVILK